MDKVSVLSQDFMAIAALVLLVGIASYTSLALTPVPIDESNPAGQIAGVSVESKVSSNLEFNKLDVNLDFEERGSQLQIIQLIPPDFDSLQTQIVEVFNKSNVDADISVAVKVPDTVKSAISINSVSAAGGEIKLLHSSEQITNPAQEFKIKAGKSITINTIVNKEGSITTPFEIVYSLQ